MSDIVSPELSREEFVFLSLVESAGTALAAKIAETNGDNTALLAVYRACEEESRDSLFHTERLMTAILAGERILSITSPSDNDFDDVRFGFAALLVRRSRWNSGTLQSSDLERALDLIEDVLNLSKKPESRVIALHKLSALSEQKYERTNDEVDLRKAIQYLETAASLTVDAKERELLLINARCLRFKIEQEVLKSILSIPLRELPDTPISFTSAASKKFRFIDAASLAAGTCLRVLEFDVLPRQRYVALSYVWRGSHTEDFVFPSLGTVSIDGAIGADPISIYVLVTVCKCVAMLDCDLLWIDGKS